jgi:surface-anchored protein
MKSLSLFALALTAGIAFPATAQTFLTSGHADIGIAYDAGSFDLHVHAEDPSPDGTEFSPPSGAVLVVGSAAQTTTPGVLSALAPVGSSLWILPKTQNPSLLFLGIGSEELTPGDWTGNLTLSLKSVSGPGNFGLYDVGTFGDVQIKWNSADGITAGDSVPVVPGSHGHFNLTFTAPGDYTIGLEASGTHAVDGAVSSGTVNYSFTVVPEPEEYAALAAAGLLGVAVWRRSRR